MQEKQRKQPNQSSQPNEYPKLGWLENWSALATFTLTAEEMSSFNPSITYKDILSNEMKKFPNGNITTSRSFSLGAGKSVSADGTRTGKVNFFFVFKDFPPPCLRWVG